MINMTSYKFVLISDHSKKSLENIKINNKGNIFVNKRCMNTFNIFCMCDLLLSYANIFLQYLLTYTFKKGEMTSQCVFS